MWVSTLRSRLLAALCAALMSVCHSQNDYFQRTSDTEDYSVLEAHGVSCPAFDKCEGYRNNLTYIDRNCECDRNCTAYKDCCIDATPRQDSTAQVHNRPPPRNDVTCLHYGAHDHSGVYVINKCSRSWNGPRKVRERCIGPDDFTDPLTAAPVTDVTNKKTYRNLACAECNNANLASLKFFVLKLACDGLTGLTEAQIMGDLTYNNQYQLWGNYRLNRFGNGTEFFGCEIVFDVPEYLINSVRFCRSNLISSCPRSFSRPEVARRCEQYLAAVYSFTSAYRNPDCAVCNNVPLGDLSCDVGVTERKKPMSFALLLDVNQSDGDQVGMRRVPTPECPSVHKYDPFFKKCRQLVCALPGYNVVNGRCVSG